MSIVGCSNFGATTSEISGGVISGGVKSTSGAGGSTDNSGRTVSLGGTSNTSSVIGVGSVKSTVVTVSSIPKTLSKVPCTPASSSLKESILARLAAAPLGVVIDSRRFISSLRLSARRCKSCVEVVKPS